MNISKKDTLLLRQFNITQNIQIKLRKIKVPIARAREQRPFKTRGKGRRTLLQRPFQSHGKLRFTCNECDFAGFSKTSLHTHLRTHEGKQRPTKVCPFCKKVFEFALHNYRHMKVCKPDLKADAEAREAKEKQFRCELCGFACIEKFLFMKHLMTHADERPFQCTICDKTFKTRAYLGEHQLRHSDKNKKCPCPLCLKLFHTKRAVNQHIPTHTGERPFKCQFCEKRYKTDGYLKIHLKVCKENPKQMDKDWVEKMKKYKCHLCNFSSLTKGNLTTHLRTHTGERPFHCRLCSYKCSTANDLNGHVRYHTGEKPFKCLQCTYRAATRSTISIHVKRHHSTEPRQKNAVCGLCSKRYYDRYKLNRHIKSQHGKYS